VLKLGKTVEGGADIIAESSRYMSCGEMVPLSVMGNRGPSRSRLSYWEVLPPGRYMVSKVEAMVPGIGVSKERSGRMAVVVP
jgi:hypothetical protein